MIVKLTYLSDNYKVKGYLGLPPGFSVTPDDVGRAVAAFYGLPADALPVDLIAGAARPRRAAIAAGPSEGMPEGPVHRADPGAAPPPPAAFPALVYCRGGIRGVGRVRPHWVDSFASRGFVVFAPAYRGDEGGEGRDEFGGADREDVPAAIRLLRTLPFVAQDRVSVMGFSRGAVNAAQAAADQPDDVRRLVLWSGVADLARTYEERVDLRRMLKRVLGGTPAKRPEAYRDRSPLHFAERLRCPTLVVHGTNDVQVDVGHGIAMHERMRSLGLPVELHLYEGYGHHLPYLVHEAAIDRMADWLRT